MPRKKKIDPNIIEQLKFIKKCEQDIVFFAENCCMVPEVGGEVKVELYDPQKDILTSFIEDHELILLKSRQCGGSYICQIICAWQMLFFKNIKIGVVSKSGPEASSFVRKTKELLRNIPQDFIRPSKILKDFEEDNAQSFTLANGSKMMSQAVSPAAPEKVLRGESLSTLIVDEAAFISKFDIAWTAVAPSLSIARRAAKRKGIPNGIIILSTPNGQTGSGEWYFKRWINALNGDNNLKPIKLYWKDLPLDEEWYKEQCIELDNDPRKILQELELQFLSSQDSIWSDDIQIKLNNVANSDVKDNKNYLEIPIAGHHMLKIYNKINHAKTYLVGVDCASEGGSDFYAVQVMDLNDNIQVMEFRGKLEPLKFAKQVVMPILDMLPRHLVVVEDSGGYGQVVLSQLVNCEEKEYNIFYTERVTGQGKNRKVKMLPGLNVNKSTRPLVIQSIFNFVNEFADTGIYSVQLAYELLSLVEKNNKIQAGSGAHDDLVMAMGLALYVRYYAPQYMNFSHKTNFNTERIEGDINSPMEYNPIESLIYDINLNDANNPMTPEQRVEWEFRIEQERLAKINEKQERILNGEIDEYDEDTERISESFFVDWMRDI